MMKIKNNFILVVFVFIFFCQCIHAAENSNLSLIKEKETIYNIFESPSYYGGGSADIRDYKFITDKYKLENHSDDKYQIISSSIDDKNDYNTFSNFSTPVISNTTRETFVQFLYSVPYILPAAPFSVSSALSFTYDIFKSPFTIYKNKKYKKIGKQNLENLKNNILEENDAVEFYTVQNFDDFNGDFYITVKNLNTDEYITLKADSLLTEYEKKSDKITPSEKNFKKNERLNSVYIDNKSNNISFKQLQFPNAKYAIKEDAAILLPNNTIFASGGLNKDNTAIQNTLIYKGGTVSNRGADLLYPRYSHKMILMPNNKILIYGGLNNKKPVKTTEVYDYSTNKIMNGFELKADLTNSNSFASILPNGNILLACVNNDFVEIYDINSNAVIVKENINTGKVYLDEDENKIYFADYNSISALDKNTFEYKIISQNNNYDYAVINAAYRMPDGRIIIAVKDFEDYLSIYEYDEYSKEKKYYARNLGTSVKFFKSDKTGCVYFITDEYFPVLYKILPSENKVKRLQRISNYSDNDTIINTKNKVIFWGSKKAEFIEKVIQ